MNEKENFKSACQKLANKGKTMSLIGEILVLAGLIAGPMLLASSTNAHLLSLPVIIAIVGFILQGTGDVLQTEASDKLQNYYREKMIRSDVKIITSRLKEHES